MLSCRTSRSRPSQTVRQPSRSMPSTKTNGEAVGITALTIGTASAGEPVIAGLPDSEYDSGNTSTHPFGSVTAADTSTGASDSATILTYADDALSDADGTLSGNGLTHTAAGTYQRAATSPAALTAELQAFIFTPSGGDSATPLSLFVTNQNGQVATASTSFNNSIQEASGSSPVISALPSTETAPGGTTVQPFGQVAVFDAGAKWGYFCDRDDAGRQCGQRCQRNPCAVRLEPREGRRRHLHADGQHADGAGDPACRVGLHAIQHRCEHDELRRHRHRQQ